LEVLEHLEQPRELAKKVYKLLAPGGYFIMSVPNRDRISVKLRRRDEWDYPPNHLTRWSKETLNSFLTRIGFTNVTVKIDGINRWALGNILLSGRLNQKITRRMLNSSIAQTKGEFFLYNPLWKFVQKLGDSIAFVSQPLGRFYGTQLIAFAQKPPSDI
jgi:SAM-dependent methyltransferase